MKLIKTRNKTYPRLAVLATRILVAVFFVAQLFQSGVILVKADTTSQSDAPGDQNNSLYSLRFVPQVVTAVAGAGGQKFAWKNVNNALVTELGADADSSMFTSSNSAQLSFLGNLEEKSSAGDDVTQAVQAFGIESELANLAATSTVASSGPVEVGADLVPQISDPVVSDDKAAPSSSESSVLATTTEPSVTQSPNENQEDSATAYDLEFSGFHQEDSSTTLPNLDYLRTLKIDISMASVPLPGAKLQVEYFDQDQTWKKAGVVNLDGGFSNAAMGGFIEYELPRPFLTKIGSSTVRMRFIPGSLREGDESDALLSIDGVKIKAEYSEPVAEEGVVQNSDTLQDRLRDQQKFSLIHRSTKTADVALPSDLSQPITIAEGSSPAPSVLSMLMIGSRAAAGGTRSGDTVTYSDVFENTDVKYDISARSLKESIVLKNSHHPRKFRYLLNMDTYDFLQASPNRIDLYKKGYLGQSLYKLYSITAPQMSDSAGRVSQKLELKLKNNLLTVIPDAEWLKDASYPVIVDPTVEISVLNVYSHPITGQYWDIEFMTTGVSDLVISPADQDTVADMQFESLACGDQAVSVQERPDHSVYVPQWQCDSVATVKFLDLRTGDHHMVFDFGGVRADAYNSAVSWTGGAGTNNWEDGGNWSSGSVPGPTDDAVIASAATVNINGPTAINSLTLGVVGGGVASVLNFNYDALSAPLSTNGDFIVYSGAVVTHSVATSGTIGGRINANIGGSLTVSGSISADSKGFTGGYGPGTAQITPHNFNAGASYGGSGGNGSQVNATGTYGSITNPTDLGSGGGNITAFGGSNDGGGSGGGSIILNVAATTTVSGAISANGGNAFSCWDAGGGSGGSVNVVTRTLAGNGAITARGGNACGNASGNGSGGRIAIKYTTDVSSVSYAYYSGTTWPNYGGSGTLYKKAAAQANGDLLLDNNNLNSSGATDERGYGKTPLPVFVMDSVTLKNNAAVYLVGSSSTSTVLTILSNSAYYAQSGTSFSYSSLTWSGTVVDSGGDLAVLRQNQNITIPSGTTLVVAALGASRTYNNVTIDGMLTHAYNTTATTGSASLYKLNWQVNGNLTVSGSGSVNVNGRGYVGGQGPGTSQITPRDNNAGGSYGGSGGNGSAVNAGSPYGSLVNPVDLGSGGGNSSQFGSSNDGGGAGGGAAIFSVTGTTTVDGVISANGSNAFNCWSPGGGSGGSIFITTTNFAGSGSLTSNGGNGCNNGGGGSGGRISVLSSVYNNSVSRSVSGGVGYGAGAAGSLYPASVPSVTSDDVTDILSTTATGHGTILDLPFYQITGYGSVWATYPNPSVPNVNLAILETGTAAASKANIGSASNAFDGNPNTYWSSNQGMSYDLEYDFPVSTVVNKYTITGNNYSGGGDSPRNWTFEAWDGSAWVSLQSISNQVSWANGESRSFNFVNTTPYAKYRLNISANNGGGNTAVAEFKLYDTAGSVASNGITNASGTFISSLTGLAPSTTYHVRMFAMNLKGSVYGTDKTITTGIPNNAPNSPSSLGPNLFVTNTWTASTSPYFTFNLSDPDGADSVKYRIRIDTNSNFSSSQLDYTSALNPQGSYGFTVGQLAGTGTYAIGGPGQVLSDNSSYYWEVQAIDGNGGTSPFSLANSGSIAFKLDSTPPNPGSITFNWLNPDHVDVVVSGASDNLSGIASYNFINLTNSATSTPGGATWTSGGLTPNTKYVFQSQVVDIAGNSASTATSSIYTAAQIPTNATTTVLSATSVRLTWDTNGNPPGTEYYAENSSATSNSGWVTATSTVFAGLSCGNSYSFHVKARNHDGVETAYSAMVSPPASPCNQNPNSPAYLGNGPLVNGSWINLAQPDLHFNLTDPDASDLVGYRMQISTTSDFSGLSVDYTSALAAQGDKTFVVGQNAGSGFYSVGSSAQVLPDSASGYYWRVKTLDQAGAESPWSVANNGLVAFRIDTILPNSGTLSLVSTSTGSVTIAVSGSQDAESGLSVAPYVFSNTDNWDNSGSTAATTWTDTNLPAGTYHYKVRVFDNAGNVGEALLSSQVSVQGAAASGGGGTFDPWASGSETLGFSVYVNQNDPITSTRNVTLQLTGQPGTTLMLVSNLPDLSDATPESYVTTKSWDICQNLGSCGNGTYSVYAKFLNGSGQSSGRVTDSILFQNLTSLVPGTLSVSAVTASSVSVSLTGSADAAYGLAAQPYRYFNRTTAGSSATTSNASWLSTSLVPNTQYDFYAIVTNANNTSGYAPDVFAYTLANVPGNVSTTTVTATAVGLTWDANGNPIGTEYQVENMTASTTTSWISATTTTVSGLACNSHYQFHVKARNANAQETGFSPALDITTSACDLPVQNPPSGGGGGPATPPVSQAPPQTPSVPPTDTGREPVLVPLPPEPAPVSNQPASHRDPDSVQPPVAPAENPPHQTGNLLPGSQAGSSTPIQQIPGEQPPSGGSGSIPASPVTPISPVLEGITSVASNVVRQLGEKISAGRTGIVSMPQLRSMELTSRMATIAIAPTTLTLESSLSTYGLSMNAGSASDIWLYFLRLVYGLLGMLGIRARRRHWGTVYDSKNKQPLDPVLVDLIDVRSGKEVDHAITDLYGKFGFLDKPGLYRIRARKTNYTFPSVHVAGSSDGIYENVYHGEELSVRNGSAPLTPNIPMDQQAFDWNQEDKKRIVKFHPRIEHILNITLELVFWAGLAWTLLVFAMRPNWLNGLFLAVYVVLAVLRKVVPHARLLGRLAGSRDVGGLYLELSPVALPTIVMGKAVTKPNGVFFLKSQPGTYLLKVKEISEDRAVLVYEGQVTIGKQGVLNKTIAIS